MAAENLITATGVNVDGFVDLLNGTTVLEYPYAYNSSFNGSFSFSTTLRPFGNDYYYYGVDPRPASAIQCTASVFLGIALSVLVFTLHLCWSNWTGLRNTRHSSNIVSSVFGQVFLICGICAVIAGTTWYPDPQPIVTQTARVLCFVGLAFFFLPSVFLNSMYLTGIDPDSKTRNNITYGIILGLGLITLFVEIPIWITGMNVSRALLIFLFSYQVFSTTIMLILGVLNLKMDARNREKKERVSGSAFWQRTGAFLILVAFTYMYIAVSNVENPNYLVVRSLEFVSLAIVLLVKILFLVGVKGAVMLQNDGKYIRLKKTTKDSDKEEDLLVGLDGDDE